MRWRVISAFICIRLQYTLLHCFRHALCLTAEFGLPINATEDSQPACLLFAESDDVCTEGAERVEFITDPNQAPVRLECIQCMIASLVPKEDEQTIEELATEENVDADPETSDLTGSFLLEVLSNKTSLFRVPKTKSGC